MDKLLASQFTWQEFLTIDLTLLVLYLVLRITLGLLGKVNFLGSIQSKLELAIRSILLFFEPLVLLILGSIFVLFNPLTHGLLLFIFLAMSYIPVRNYISGRIILFDKEITIGSQMRIQEIEGIISKIGRVGLQVSTNGGSHFINYTKMLEEGFTLLKNEKMGGFYYLKVKPKDSNNNPRQVQRLQDLLMTTPYLNHNHSPKLSSSPTDPQVIDVWLSVQEEKHLQELLALMKQWGYSVELSTEH